jgi:DNA-binding transcriptional MerR regulator
LEVIVDKSTEAFRTIGEMARQLGIRTHILRYWEEQFPMLQPLKRAGGRRHYRPDDVALLVTINRLLGQEGYTIRGARKFLEGHIVAPVPQSVSASVSTDGISASALQAIRNRLANALEAA